MYLTEIILQDEFAARLFPSNPYDWHRSIWSFFPNKSERDFLYRVDSNSRGVRLLILSETRPLSPFAEENAVFRCKKIPEHFLLHKLYRFQIRVNPTKRIKVDARTGNRIEKGIRVPITDEGELLQWFKRKGEAGGFSLPACYDGEDNGTQLTILPESRLNFQKPGNKRAHHASVQFTGILRVEDTSLFIQTLRHGIGSAKSFGFGLLMLQPLN